MKNYKTRTRVVPLLAALTISTLPLSALAATAPPTSGVLFENKAGAEFKSEGANAEVVEENGAKVLKATFPEGNGYPAFAFPKPDGGWDLSKYSGVQVDVTNTSVGSIKVALRVDNAGDWKKQPWNTESVTLKAGETKTIKVNFGKSYGGNPGYALDPSKVSAIKIFAENPKQETVVVVKNLQAFGTASTPTPATSTTVSTPAPVNAAGPIFDISKADADAFKTQGNTVVRIVEADGAKIVQAEFPAGEGYPALDFPVPAGSWKLAGTAGVQVDIINKSEGNLEIAMRVDEAGDWKKSPWNTQSTWVKAGETKTLKVTYGKSYGNAGYPLDPAKVSNIKIFAVNPRKGGTIQVKNLQSFGTASTNTPATTTTANTPAAVGKPGTNTPAIDGVLLHFDEAKLARYKTNQSTVSGVTQDGAPALQVTFATGEQSYPSVQLPIPTGNWNLSSFGGVQAEIYNPGDKSARILMRVDNAGNWKDNPWNTQSLTIPAGQTKTLNLKFGENNGAPGYPLDPSRVVAMQFFMEKPKAETTFVVKSVRAFGSPAAGSSALSTPADKDVPVTPAAWVGKRPPVEGNWVQTLNENFDGPTLNEKIWRTETWWNGLLPGQTQRYSKDNLIFENGILRMKTEKRRGHQNDDPNLPEKEYTTGHIITYDKWTQLYGYFEARVKLPTARGLWPAFWMMPDRGAAAGPEGWKRESTKDGGMEIDILEHLTEWGSGRNNVAVHWDGYDKDHQSWGTSNVYFGPTPDGWHTFGLLWEPGMLTWFIDGIKKSEYENARVGSIPAYLLLNVQMGGWATKDVDDSKLPDYFDIDYVRAWQLKDRIKL